MKCAMTLYCWLRDIWGNSTFSEKCAWGLIFAGAGIASAFLFQIITNHLTWYDGKISIESSGQAGSFIGGTAGALWALAGVLFFISALSLQRKELDMQREELKLQRNEMKLQRDEMESTRLIFEQQLFESTLTTLLSKLDTIVKNQNDSSSIPESFIKKVTNEAYRKHNDKYENMNNKNFNINNTDHFLTIYKTIRKSTKLGIADIIDFILYVIEAIDSNSCKKDDHIKLLSLCIRDKLNTVLFYEYLINDTVKNAILSSGLKISRNHFEIPSHTSDYDYLFR